ncbi:RNA polymerase sigma factor [Agaribacter flavus]|uniref:RNA polymerase sigma factor n=1 Tax=Agaribacter flavus TaxID=1902781 RepID=A0ABV7FV64_9ALTE
MKSSFSPSFLFTPSLRNYVRKLVQRDCDIDDVLQETYIKMSSATTPIEHPQGYAKKVARNIAFDMHRCEANMPEAMPHEPSCHKTNLDKVMHETQRIELYQSLISAMPKLRQEVFIRYRVEGQDKKHIAKVLNISVDSVDKHISRAMHCLKSEMAKLMPADNKGE